MRTKIIIGLIGLGLTLAMPLQVQARPKMNAAAMEQLQVQLDDEMGSLLPSRESSPESQFLARERAQQVSAALESLSVNQRTIFLMRFIEEMDLQEICEATGMQISTVKTHLHRAVKAVRLKLGGKN